MAYDIKPDFPETLSSDAAKAVIDKIRGVEVDAHCLALAAWHVSGYAAGQTFQHPVMAGSPDCPDCPAATPEQVADALEHCVRVQQSGAAKGAMPAIDWKALAKTLLTLALQWLS